MTAIFFTSALPSDKDFKISLTSLVSVVSSVRDASGRRDVEEEEDVDGSGEELRM